LIVLFLILIVSVNLLFTTGAAAFPNENSGYDQSVCIFSVLICLYDQQSRGDIEHSTAEQYINSALDQVNSTELEIWINNLSSFYTRHTKSDHIESVAYWLKYELQSVCNGKTYYHNFTQIDQGTKYNLRNIICDRNHGSVGSGNEPYILISAHYDSRMQDINQTKTRAPGADDNASGVAAVLELARILSKLNLENNIRFVLFSGEEQGQWGSKAYVEYLHANNMKLDLVINLDMIGYPALGPDNVSIEYDQGNKFTTNDIHSKRVGEFITHIALKYVNLNATMDPFGRTDLIPFEATCNIVIGLHDGGSKLNPNYHNTSDTPDTLDMGYLTSVTKLVLAAILNIDRQNQ
jgi:acetylornithine deacetylase/succinyl-diaminopimelate desuccinylase-like protein